MDSLCELIHHADTIAEVRLHDNSRRAVDVMAAHIKALIEDKDPSTDGTLRLLVNMSDAGLPSMSYITRTIREWYAEHQATVEALHIKEAIIAPDDYQLLLPLASTVTRLLPLKADVKFYETDEYDEALHWLRSDDDA